ncbi:MAG TPA: hypothetical protein VL201_04385 [Patescibacteria group bacterium]|jgi:hypothetical protein|nr:hypothetical protein [Patescibacteria group bacterium]
MKVIGILTISALINLHSQQLFGSEYIDKLWKQQHQRNIQLRNEQAHYQNEAYNKDQAARIQENFNDRVNQEIRAAYAQNRDALYVPGASESLNAKIARYNAARPK